MTNTLCEAIRHDLHAVGAPGNAPVGAPGGIPSEIQPAALGAVQGAETQTILGPVPLSVAIATTMKQLREECPELFSDTELFSDAELSACAEQKHAGPRIDPHEMEIDMNTDRLSPEQALTIARALAEAAPWTNAAPPAAAWVSTRPAAPNMYPLRGTKRRSKTTPPRVTRRRAPPPRSTAL